MNRNLVYDFPTRAFHWIFATLFVTAFVIAKTVDADSPVFNYHSIAGLTLNCAIALRIVWGFVGTRYARFQNFELSLKELISYFKGILKGDKKRWAGHNPASSVAAIVMMLCGIGLGVTGYLMTSGPNKETFEDIHEVLANGFCVVAITHVLGIILHTLRFKEIIGLSMITGKKENISEAEKIERSWAGVGFVYIVIVLIFASYLFKNYDSQTRSLKFFGVPLQLSEVEHDNHDNRDLDD